MKILFYAILFFIGIYEVSAREYLIIKRSFVMDANSRKEVTFSHSKLKVKCYLEVHDRIPLFEGDPSFDLQGENFFLYAERYNGTDGLIWAGKGGTLYMTAKIFCHSKGKIMNRSIILETLGDGFEIIESIE